MGDFAEHWYAALQPWGEPQPPVLQRLAAASRSCSQDSGAYIARAGEHDSTLYHLQTGLWRLFYTRADGREFTRAFITPGMFFVALDAELRQAPLRYSLQALERSTALALPYAVMQRACHDHLDMARLWQRHMEAHFLRRQAREEALLLQTPEQRYREFVAQQPQLAQRVSLQHLASFLGITNVSLSRIRGRIAAGD